MPIPPLKYRRVLAGAASTGLIVALFCRHLLQRNPGTFFNDDYQLSILPVFADVARAWNQGQWPLLSPYSWACSNLAGEYQYGTFSVFVNAVVVAVWKFPLTLAQKAAGLSVTHLAVLAAGAYLLARVRKLPASLAVGVGLIAALNGWEMGWGATDWFGALAAHAWLPWCWWAFEVALGEGGSRKWEVGSEKMGTAERLRFLLPVPFVYLLVSAGFPYTVVMLGLVTAWLAVREWWERGWEWRTPLALGTGWGLGLLLSAPAWLSLLEAVHGSGRSQEGVGAGNLAWTVPIHALPGLILPNWTSLWPDFANRPCLHGALELAGGLVPTAGLVAAFAGLGWIAVRVLRWELLLLAVVLLLCLLPSPGLFRWSFRWLPLLHLVLALAGGRALLLLAAGGRRGVEGCEERMRRADARRGYEERMRGADARSGCEERMREARGGRRDGRQKAEGRRQKAEDRGNVVADADFEGVVLRLLRNPGVWAAGAVALTWAGMKVFRMEGADPSVRGLAPWTLVVAVAWAGVEMLPMPRGWRLWGASLATFASLWVTYRFAHTNTGLPIYPVGENLTQIAPLSPDRLYLSLYREPDQFYRDWQVPKGFGAVVRMGSMGMYAGVRMINGYSPIMAQGVGKAFHIETHGNVPEAVGTRLLTEEAGASGVLERLGVDGIILTHDYGTPARPPGDTWEMTQSHDEGDVYERRGGPLGTVRSWTSAEPGGPVGYAAAQVRVVADARQRVEAEVDVPAGGAPGLIAFARPFFPGYRATLDGRTLAVGSFRGLMPTVEVPAGSRGRLVLRYVPRAVAWGGALAALGALVAVGLAARAVLTKH